MMGLGMMIGAGVFVGMGICMGLVGPGGLVLTFALNGLIALFTAMSFAELSSAIPRAGGAYNFARIAFGRGPSFLGGWMEWFASSLAGAFYAVIFASFSIAYLNQIFAWGLSEEELFVPVRITAVVAALGFLYINYRGSSETGKLGAIFTVAQMGFVLAIAAVGVVMAFLEPERVSNFKPFMPRGWWKMLGSMGIIYVAFEGFEVIAQAGDETIDPKRNVPKAMLYSVAIVTVTYVLVGFATVVAVHPDVTELPVWRFIGDRTEIEGFRTAVNHLVPAGSLLVTLAVLFSSTSALNATIYSATRASYALGRDGMLPPWFARIGARRRTPHLALAMTGIIVLGMAVWMRPRDLSATASMMFLLLFFLVNLCVIRVRLHMGDELEYGFLMPLFPLLPILAIVLQAALCAGIFAESAVAWVVAGVWVPGGAVVYWLYSRTRAPTGAHDIQVIEERPAPLSAAGEGTQRYRIMVSVANPDNALELVEASYKLCGAKQARVELLHMVPVPEQVPLKDAHRYMAPGREGIVEAMLYLAPQFPLTTHLRYCRSISRGIVSAVRQKHIDMLILGWHGRKRSRLFSVGSTIDPIIERSPCNVVILKGTGGTQAFRRVLVPVAGGPNSDLAMEVASILVEPEEGTMTVLNVGAASREGMDLDAYVREQQWRLKVAPDRVCPKRVVRREVTAAILDEAAEHDLVVLGTTGDPRLYQFARASVPESVAEQCPKPLVMVKSATRFRSRLRRWV